MIIQFSGVQFKKIVEFAILNDYSFLHGLLEFLFKANSSY